MKTERIEIDLGDGARVMARALSPFDYAVAGKAPKGTPDSDPDAWERFGLELSRIMLTRCTGKVTLKDGKLIRMVDKPFDEVLPGELSVDEVPAAWMQKITTAIGQMGQEEAVPLDAGFPEAQPDAAD